MILGIVLSWLIIIGLFVLTNYYWNKNNKDEDDDKQHYLVDPDSAWKDKCR